MTSVGPTSPSRPAVAPARPPVETTAARDQSFTALLGDPKAPRDNLSFNRARRDASSTRSFAEMPLVAPVSIELIPLPVKPVAPSQDVVSALSAQSDTMLQTDAQEPVTLSGRFRSTDQHADLCAKPVDPVAKDTAARHFAAAPAITSSVGNDAGDARKIALRPSRPAPPRSVAVSSFELGMGAGLSVHVVGDDRQPRVVVRGARLDADERGETTTRIVRLLRGHGYVVSEKSIEFEGGER